MKRSIRTIMAIIIMLAAWQATPANADEKKIVVFKIFDEINSTSWITTQGAFALAEAEQAHGIIMHLNTYGGEVVYADSIRTRILNSTRPVYAFIDNNAASAGALISIACDSIYMRPGANIGAATVVNGGTGEKMPDKYQSYMRSTMRSTAEAHGCDTIITRNDTIIRWHRNPSIAEAMVDESVVVEGIIEDGKILTFTTEEAIANGFCEGKADNIRQVATAMCGADHTIIIYEPSTLDKVKGFLSGTALRGILILIILGGIYFELQTPGVGFPLLAAAVAAIVYFAPLYIDGLAANWEILIFLAGIALLVVEIFVTPGFGIAGVAGMVCMVLGLAFSLVGNDYFDFSDVPTMEIHKSLLLVSLSTVAAIVACLAAGRLMAGRRTTPFARLVLDTTQQAEDGYVGTDTSAQQYIGQMGIAFTPLRPGGKVAIGGEILDAISDEGFIGKGETVKVKSMSGGQVVVGRN